MLQHFLSFLKDLPAARGQAALGPVDDPRIAAAALMVHVMDADGVRRREEGESLRRALATTYGISGAALDALLTAGEKAEQEAVDIYAFNSVIKRHLDEKEREELYGIMLD